MTAHCRQLPQQGLNLRSRPVSKKSFFANGNARAIIILWRRMRTRRWTQTCFWIISTTGAATKRRTVMKLQKQNAQWIHR